MWCPLQGNPCKLLLQRRCTFLAQQARHIKLIVGLLFLLSKNLISRVMVIFWLTLIACISYVSIHMKQYYSDSLKKMDSQQSKPVVLVYWFHFFIACFAVVHVLLLTFRHSPLSWKISCQPNVKERFKLTLLKQWKRYVRSMMIKVQRIGIYAIYWWWEIQIMYWWKLKGFCRESIVYKKW